MLNLLNFTIFLLLKTVLILANSAGPDEMLPKAAFHVDLHCLPKYLFPVSRMKRVKRVGLYTVYSFKMTIFIIFLRTYEEGTEKKCLSEVVLLMSTLNMSFDRN